MTNMPKLKQRDLLEHLPDFGIIDMPKLKQPQRHINITFHLSQSRKGIFNFYYIIGRRRVLATQSIET